VTDISLENVSVIVGMPAHRPIPVQTVISINNTVAYCLRAGIPIDLVIPAGSSVVMTARNQICHSFLKTTASHLFWIDSDMQWSVESFLRVLAMATIEDTARAIYPRRQENIMFDMDGIGFTCVQRKVIQALADRAPMLFIGEAEPCKAIFRESFVETDRATAAGADLEYFAEDSTFFADVKRLGFTSWVDPKSYIGHVGDKVYRASLEERWEMKQTPDDARSQHQVEEARDGTADRVRAQSREEADETGTREVEESDYARSQSRPQAGRFAWP
jgi:hypothetical protein